MKTACSILLCFSLGLGAVLAEQADGEAIAPEVELGAGSAVESVLPVDYPMERYEDQWKNSPFNRVVVKAVETKISSTFGKNLVLEGLVSDKRRGPMAFVRDTKENVPFMISSEESSAADYPFTIVSTNKNPDPQKTTVTITDGNEQAEIGYQANILTQSIQAPQQQASSKPNDQSASQRAREAQLRNQRANQPAQPNRPTQPGPGNSQPKAEKESPSDPLDAIDDAPRRRMVPLPKGAQ